MIIFIIFPYETATRNFVISPTLALSNGQERFACYIGPALMKRFLLGRAAPSSSVGKPSFISRV